MKMVAKPHTNFTTLLQAGRAWAWPFAGPRPTAVLLEFLQRPWLPVGCQTPPATFSVCCLFSLAACIPPTFGRPPSNVKGKIVCET